MDLVSAVEPLTINLTRDTDWIRVLEAESPEEFPAGAIVEIRWFAGDVLLDTGTTWRAVVTATEATWNIDKVDVNALIAMTPTKAKLFYLDGTLDLLWAMATTVGIDG